MTDAGDNQREIEKTCPTCSQGISFPEGSSPKLCYHCGKYLSNFKRNYVFFLTNLGVAAAILSAIFAYVSTNVSKNEARKAEEAAELANTTVEALIEPLLSSLDVELARFVDVYDAGYGKDRDEYESQIDAQLIVIERLLNNIESLVSKTGRESFSQFERIDESLMPYYFGQNAAIYEPLENLELDRRVHEVFTRTSELSR